MFQQSGGVHKLDTLILKYLPDAADQRCRVLLFQRRQQFEETPVRLNRGKDADVFYLSRHHHFGNAFALENVDQLSQLADVDPVERLRQLGQFGGGLVLNCDDHHLVSLAASRLEREGREAAIAGDESVFLRCLTTQSRSYLTKPRED